MDDDAIPCVRYRHLCTGVLTRGSGQKWRNAERANCVKDLDICAQVRHRERSMCAGVAPLRRDGRHHCLRIRPLRDAGRRAGAQEHTSAAHIHWPRVRLDQRRSRLLVGAGPRCADAEPVALGWISTVGSTAEASCTTTVCRSCETRQSVAGSRCSNHERTTTPPVSAEGQSIGLGWPPTEAARPLSAPAADATPSPGRIIDAFCRWACGIEKRVISSRASALDKPAYFWISRLQFRAGACRRWRRALA